MAARKFLKVKAGAGRAANFFFAIRPNYTTPLVHPSVFLQHSRPSSSLRINSRGNPPLFFSLAFFAFSTGVGTDNPQGALQVNAADHSFVVKSTGSVGIGTDNPPSKLSVFAPSAGEPPIVAYGYNGAFNARMGSYDSDNGALEARDSSGISRILLHSAGNSYINGGSLGIGTASPTQKLDVNGSANVASNIFVGANGIFAGSGVFFGNVGIGTSSPQAKLHVSSHAIIDGDLTVGGKTNFATQITSINVTNINVTSATMTEVHITSVVVVNNMVASSAVIRDQLKIGENSVFIGPEKQGAGNEITFTGGDGFIRTESSSDDLILADDNSAKVGIGTKGPISKLSVNGDVRLGSGMDLLITKETSPDTYVIDAQFHDLKLRSSASLGSSAITLSDNGVVDINPGKITSSLNIGGQVSIGAGLSVQESVTVFGALSAESISVGGVAIDSNSVAVPQNAIIIWLEGNSRKSR